MFPESLDKGQQIMNHAFLHLVLGCTSYSSFVLLPCADKGTQNLMIIRYMEIVLYCGKIIDDSYLISPGTWSTATQPSSCELICTWTFVNGYEIGKLMKLYIEYNNFFVHLSAYLG